MFRSNKTKEEHETIKLQNEEVTLKTFKTLINEVNIVLHAKWETSQEKAFCNTNIEKIEIFHVLHEKVALLIQNEETFWAGNK